MRVERDGPVTTVILSRPDVRNAVDGPTATALADAFLAFERDPDAQVARVLGRSRHVLRRARTSRPYQRGRGVRAARQPRRRARHRQRLGSARHRRPDGPARMLLSKPVIAAVSGYAVAGGLELALWCDLRVVEEDAVFGVFCRRWGVPLIDGGTVRLPRIVGHGRALDMILTGRPVARRRGARDRARQPRRAARRRAPRGRGARARARALPADLHARRPPLGLRAVGPPARRARCTASGSAASRRSAPARRSRVHRASPRGTAAAAASTICERTALAMIRALVFDLDGLILDTESVVYASWESAYRDHGVPLPLDLWHLAIGSDETHFEPLSYLLARRPDLDVDGAAGAAARAFATSCSRARRRARACSERLAEASARGLRLAVASSSGARVGRAPPRPPRPARALLRAALPRGRRAREAGSHALPRRARGARRRARRRRSRSRTRRTASRPPSRPGMRCVAIPGPMTRGLSLRRRAPVPGIARRAPARRDPRARWRLTPPRPGGRGTS